MRLYMRLILKNKYQVNYKNKINFCQAAIIQL